MNERENSVKFKNSKEAQKLKTRYKGELGQKRWKFYKLHSQKHFYWRLCAEGPGICSLLNNWLVYSSVFALIKRKFCSLLTSVEIRRRELGQKLASQMQFLIIGFQARVTERLGPYHFGKFFISSSQKAQGISSPKSHHGKGLRLSLNHLRS